MMVSDVVDQQTGAVVPQALGKVQEEADVKQKVQRKLALST